MLAESLGFVAIVINVIAYRQEDANQYRWISAVALGFLSAHFFMIDAMAAGIACGLSVVRNLVAMRSQAAWIALLFVLLNLGFLAYEWFWLNHAWVIFIAYVSSIVFTIGSVVLTCATRIRQWFLLAEGLGLLYSILVGSVSGTLFNSANLASIGLKLLQERRIKSK